MRRRLPAAAGLLLALALPMLVSAHEITEVQVDCDGQAIHVSGKLFGQDGGATVTVTGPDGYSESFLADQDEEWTVTLPLGPDEGVAPTPTGAVLPAIGSTDSGPAPTLPPTDTAGAAGDGSSPAAMASLALFGLAASVAWVSLAAIERRMDHRERSRPRARGRH